MKHRIFMIILGLLPKEVAHKILYKKIVGKKLNLKKPEDLNEKIQYLILYMYGLKESNLSDKYLVKEYVEKLNISNLNIPKTYKIYQKAEDINIDDLPDKFVLKCNHGSGNVQICQSKQNFDINLAKKILKKTLKTDFSKTLLEYHYSEIKPLIIAEEYLDDSKNKNPLDYKFYCYDGIVKSILVCSERDKQLRLDDFDLNWDKLDYTHKEYKSSKEIEKPKHLEQMIEIASKLSKGIPFVRVDLYEIEDKIYFGEYTFTPCGGVIKYYKEEALQELGKGIDLNKYENRKDNI